MNELDRRSSALHDLKNLAGTVSLYLDAALAEQNCEDGHALVEAARSSAHALSNRLVLLLLESQAELPLAVNPGYVRLDDFMDELRCSVVLRPGKTFQIEVKGVSGEEVFHFDAYLVRQVLEAALHNADRHTAGIPLVRVVRGNGSLSFQVENTVDLPAERSTGFGSQIAQRIAQGHSSADGRQGVARLELDEKRATFTLSLPVDEKTPLQ